MPYKYTDLFLPEEHLILSSWLGVKPICDVPPKLSVEDSLSRLELDKDVCIHSTEDHAVACILLERIQKSLPQWVAVGENSVVYGRKHKERSANRIIELTSRRLMTINWADTAPGYSWPEEYRITYVPLYDVNIITGSVDSTEMYGVTDFALGYFSSKENERKRTKSIIQSEWLNLLMYHGQNRWVYLFDEGTIKNRRAKRWASEVWSPYFLGTEGKWRKLEFAK